MLFLRAAMRFTSCYREYTVLADLSRPSVKLPRKEMRQWMLGVVKEHALL